MVAHRIVQLRRRMGWTQRQLADAAGVNLTTVRKWEDGISDPSAQNILRLCELFCVSADYLLGKEDTPCIYIGALGQEEQQIISALAQLYINLMMRKKKRNDI